jgi:hypothetical protein
MRCGTGNEGLGYSRAAAAARACGFTQRQARFFVLVLEHSGVCLPPAFALRASAFALRATARQVGAAGRQYRAFAAIAHGRQTHVFFDKLVRGDFATTDLAAPAHAGRIFHLQYRPWYRALGEPDRRHRKPVRVARALKRLMVLDGVLAEPKVTWPGLAHGWQDWPKPAMPPPTRQRRGRSLLRFWDPVRSRPTCQRYLAR